MKNFRKIVAVLLCICMTLSFCFTGAGAAENTVTVSCEDDLKNLELDVPVVYIIGLEGEFYKGLSTETEDDDEQIWGFPADLVVDVIFSNLPALIWNLIINDYDAIADLLGDAANDLFGPISCDTNGKPDPDTGKKDISDYELQDGYGYENNYKFVYDWRLDMSTIAAQLDEYINYVMELTGSDKVALAAMSMGNSVLTTYLYEYYYTAENYAERNHIESVLYIAGAMNGVNVCEDPFSGNIKVDSLTLMRFLNEILGDDNGIYKFLEVLYTIGMVDPLVNYVDNLTAELIEHGFNDSVIESIATIPGFYALMGKERYEEVREFIFNTPEKRAKYAKLIEMSDYYHYSVQATNADVIQSLLDDGINTAIFAEYGFTMAPLTSDNDRMTDSTISTYCESFGATCSEVDGTLGEGYVQAKKCVCGKNHVSADNQIDASTCKFPDITWFGKYMRHTSAESYIAEWADLIIYSDEQKTVWSYEEYPQFLIATEDETMVPLTAENAGEPAIPFEEKLFKNKTEKKIKEFLGIE